MTMNSIKQFKQIDEDFHELFLQDLIALMGTLFTSPEEDIVTQGEKSTHLYFLVAGSCIQSRNDSCCKNRIKTIKLLTPGDHFGEIGLLYNCERTCSISSVDYNIVARLAKPKLHAIT